MSIDEDGIQQAWRAAVAAVERAAEAYREAGRDTAGESPGDIMVFARPRRPPLAQYWMASVDPETRKPLDFQTLAEMPAIQQAGEALTELADRLYLVKDEGLTEYLVALTGEAGVFIDVESNPPQETFVAFLGDPERVVDFVRSRQPRDPASPWDIACGKRLIRRDPELDVNCQIEPEAVWFVEWLEARGAETIASSGGHPDGFHVTFRGPQALGEAMMQRSGLCAVIPANPKAPDGTWHVFLSVDADSYEDRDTLLRALAEDLEVLQVE